MPYQLELALESDGPAANKQEEGMLKSLEWIAVAAGVVLLLSLVGVAYLSSPPSGHPREQQASAQAEQQNQTEEKHSVRGFIRYLFPDGIAVFTFFLVLATIILGVVAIVQIGFLERAETIAAQSSKATKEAADATRDAVKLAEDTAKRQLRAYVFVNKAEIRVISANQPLQVLIEIKNAGQTPAYRLRASLQAFVTAFPLADFPALPPPGRASDLGPHSEVFVGPTPLAIVLSPEHWQAFVAGEWAFYAHGTITYADAFGEPRVTDFRFFYRNNGDPIADGAVLALSHDKEGNAAN
jgi:hypothetical protein